MNRRQFLSATAASLASEVAFAQDKPRRVGLIGCGWYGKADLFRLVQVAPVEIVSLCDVDKKMLAQAAEMAASRQKSRKTPRTYGDYREMLKEKDLDIVLVATPDHWHALAMIAAVKAGADVYCQKPISVDVVESQAMLAAARKYKRVVQIGCYYHMRNTSHPPDTHPPENLDYEMWTGPAPMRPYNQLTHPGSWRLFMEYCNGIVGDMCIHMFDMVRWMLELGWPKRISSSGGILVQREAKANTTDTQMAAFDYGDLKVIWQHRTWGAPPDPKYTWAAIFYGEKGTLKVSVYGYDFIPEGKGNGEAAHR